MMNTPTLKLPPMGRVRFANVEDAPAVLKLINEPVAKTFRVECVNDIIYLIENAILSICQLDIAGTVIGFLSARDYPLIPSVYPAGWESFIWTKYRVTEMNARNSLFIHLLCWNPSYQRELVDFMLKSVFMHDPYVHYIAMVKSVPEYPMLVPGQSRSEASFKMLSMVESRINVDKLPILFLADRETVSPRLRIRRAVEEDNDDLVPIIENHSDRLRELYGEFYISELISRHPESDRVLLVCEHRELAVGVMCLNTTVNYEALEESYILSPFGGLRHLETVPDSSMKDVVLDPSSISIFPVASQGLLLLVYQMWLDISFYTERLPSAFRNPEGKHQSKELLEAESESPEPEFQFEEYRDPVMEFLLEDDEGELEFDIVNIDLELLRVPEVLCPGLPRAAEAVEEILEEKTPRIPSKLENVGSRRSMDKLAVSGCGMLGKSPEPIRYKGTPNAFLIELFAVHPHYDERYGFDILEAAFELFPNRDYCIISLPSNKSPFPLLEHFTLATPIGSRLRFINESLYVAHVNSVRGNMSVRWGEHYDVTALQDVLMNTPRSETYLNLYQSTLGSKTLESFVFLSENQPIGMIVIGPLEDGTAVRTQYDLEPEPRRPGTDATILAGVMSPALEPHKRWFMREVLRQSRYSTLFWIGRLFAKGDANPGRNLMSLASHMNPVHPRRAVPNISGNRDLDDIYKQIHSPFALWKLEKPMTSLPKVFVNNNIVVVGASRTGLAFIETLLMGPTSQYLTFSNVTLVSEHGLPTVTDCLKAADICVPRDGRFTDRYIKSVPFYFYIDVISAVMVAIDRKRKCIRFKCGTTKYYDELVLTCGQQFQHPEYLEDAITLAQEIQKGNPCERLLMDNPNYKEDRVPPPSELPSNVFLINSLFEANINLKKLMRMISDIKEEHHCLSVMNPVVVYGDHVEAYSCMAALLELGIQPRMIIFVEPFPPEGDPTALRVNCFNNEIVDQRVQARLKELGIRVLRKCYLASWQMVDDFVHTLDLMTPLHSISLKCFALFYYGLRAISLHAFKAVNECGLVYDGGLVVSPTFETNDPYIYAAGTCISYSRKLYTTRRFHRNYCTEDIGEALAKLFLRRLDPFVRSKEYMMSVPSEILPHCSSSSLGFLSQHSLNTNASRTRTEAATNAYRRWQPVMKFESPIAQSATLPGPLYYMKLRKCGKEIPMAVQEILPYQGHTLKTDKNGNYFLLQLNHLHAIDAVTCLSKKEFSTDIMSQLFGQHGACYNKLLIRFLKNQIDDLYEYFTQPWMSALYQETFRELIDDINSQDVGMIYDLMKSKFALYDERPRGESLAQINSEILSLRTSLTPSMTSRDSRKLGTFRSMIEKYLGKKSIFDTNAEVEGPTICGQDRERHKDARLFWERVSGERIVSAHLAKYLDRNQVTNPHYAKPLPEYNTC